MEAGVLKNYHLWHWIEIAWFATSR